MPVQHELWPCPYVCLCVNVGLLPDHFYNATCDHPLFTKNCLHMLLPLQLKLVVPHHKNSTVWGNVAITYNLPYAWVEKSWWYISHGHKCLTRDTGERCLFVSSKGKAFRPSDLTYWFTSLQRTLKMKLGGDKNGMPPGQLRHVFITALQDMRAHKAADQPEQDPCMQAQLPLPGSSAMAMGNSMGQWNLTYDRNYRRRDVEACIMNMPAFIARAHL